MKKQKFWWICTKVVSQYISEKLKSLDELLFKTQQAITDNINVIPIEELEQQIIGRNLTAIWLSAASSFIVKESEIIHKVEVQTKFNFKWPVFIIVSALSNAESINLSESSLYQFLIISPDNTTFIKASEKQMITNKLIDERLAILVKNYEINIFLNSTKSCTMKNISKLAE